MIKNCLAALLFTCAISLAQTAKSEDLLTALADEYLLSLSEMEEKVCRNFACAAEGEAFAAYENRNSAIARQEVFLLGSAEDGKRRFFASGVRLGSIGEKGVYRIWDETLSDDGVITARRIGMEDASGQINYRSKPGSVREYPAFSPFALLIVSRMGFMAKLANRSFLRNLATESTEIAKAERNEKGNLVGYWVVNSKNCVVKIEFDSKKENLPIYVEWRVLLNSKSYEDTIKDGWPECVSHIQWKKEGKYWLPENLKKTDNGTELRSMMEEWNLEFRWCVGKKCAEIVPEAGDRDWLSNYQRPGMFDESWTLMSKKPKPE